MSCVNLGSAISTVTLVAIGLTLVSVAMSMALQRRWRNIRDEAQELLRTIDQRSMPRVGGQQDPGQR